MFYQCTSFVDTFDRFVGIALNLIDQGRNLFGRFGRLLSQFTDLFSDYGKAASLFAGPCGLNCGVKRQKVGLPGDAGDRGDKQADFFGPFAQFADEFTGSVGSNFNVFDFVYCVANILAAGLRHRRGRVRGDNDALDGS